MKTKTIIVALCATIFSLGASAQGIEFFKGDFNAAFEKAQEENKILFVDFYTEWCGPCKRMSADVFPNTEVGDFFRDRIIAIKVDAEAIENQAVVKRFKIKSYPSLLFLGANNEVISLTSGSLSVSGFLRLSKIATGEMPPFTKLYDEYRASNNNVDLARQLLTDAPNFMVTLEPGMEHDKWRVRIEKIFKDYFKTNKGPAIITAEDYRIIRTFNPEPQANDEIAEFIVQNLDEYLRKVGTAPAYYVIEYNSRVLGSLAQSGKQEYSKWLDRISGDMAPAYALLPKTSLTPQERETYRYNGEYILFSKKDAQGYIDLMTKYFEIMGDQIDASTYAEAAQRLYRAMGTKLNREMHLAAKDWMITALSFEDNTIFNRVNYLVMLGDTFRELGEYPEAKKLYNQAYLEVVGLGRPATQASIQMIIKQKLGQLP